MSKSMEKEIEMYEKFFDIFLKDMPQKDELKEVVFNFIRSKPFRDLIDFIAKWIVGVFIPKPDYLKKFKESKEELIDSDKKE